jgi:hypothetical protein
MEKRKTPKIEIKKRTEKQFMEDITEKDERTHKTTVKEEKDLFVDKLQKLEMLKEIKRRRIFFRDYSIVSLQCISMQK